MRYRVRMRMPDGTRVDVIEPTRELAERTLDEKRMQRVELRSGAVAAGRATEDHTITYRDLAPELTEYVEAGLGRQLKHSTIVGYRSALKKLLEYWGARRPAFTTDQEVTAYVSALRRAGMKRQTIANLLCRLNQMHEQAVRSGYLRRRPVDMKLPARGKGEGRRKETSEELVTALIAKASSAPFNRDPRCLAILLLAADAGLRRSDVYLPRGEHIILTGDDRALGWIRIPALDDEECPKDGEWRDVPILTPRLHAALTALKPQRGHRLLGRIKSGPGIDNIMKPLWRALKVPAQMHSLRHRFCSWAQIELMVPLPIVSQWLGHARVTTTAIYTHGRVEPPIGTVQKAGGIAPPAHTVTPMPIPAVPPDPVPEAPVQPRVVGSVDANVIPFLRPRQR